MNDIHAPKAIFYNEIVKRTRKIQEERNELRRIQYIERIEREKERLKVIDKVLDQLVDDIMCKFEDNIRYNMEKGRNSANIFVYKRGEKYNDFPLVFLTRGPRNEEDYFKKAFPNVKSLFNSIKPIIDENIDNIAGIEVPLWSKHLGVAGRCDCIADWKGEKAILDWKTSNKIKKEEWCEDYFLQATAYSIMFEERTGIPINRIVIVMAVENEEPLVFEKRAPDYWKALEQTLREWL